MVVQSSVRLYLESDKAYNSVTDCHKEYRFDKHIRARDNHVIQIELLDAEIPVSFYSVNSNNNELKVVVSGVVTTFVVTPGNHNAEDIRDLFNAVFAPGITATWVSASNKFSFQGTTAVGGGGDGHWSFQAARGNVIFGVNAIGQAADSDFKISGGRMANLGGINNIFIKLLNVNLENLDSQGRESGILAKVVIDQGFGGLVHFEDLHHARNLLTETNVSMLDIKLVDLNGDSIGGDTGFNGVPWSLSLLFTFIPREESNFSGKEMLNKLTLLMDQKSKRDQERNKL